MAVLLFVIFLVVLLWETHRLVTLGAFAAFFLVAGVVGVLVLKRRLAQRPKMFASSLGELVKDEDAAEVNRRRLDQIYARRERLLGRSAAQRDELALLLAPLKGPLAVADRGIAVAHTPGHTRGWW